MEALVARAAVRRYERPADVPDAYRLWREADGAARLLGGGTDLALHPPAGTTMLIDLGRLPLTYVERRGETIAVGATTTLSAIGDHPACTGLAGGLLPAVMRQLGSRALRNVATIGGHLARGHLSDLVPALLVLDADVVLFDGGEQVMPLADYYERGLFRELLLLTEVRLPVPATPDASGFVRFTRTAFDFAILNCAVALQLTDGVAGRARVAAGETPALARRVPVVEEWLAGRRLDDETVAGAAVLAEEHVPTADDQRASAAYRRHLVGVGLRRALLQAAGRPQVAP